MHYGMDRFRGGGGVVGPAQLIYCDGARGGVVANLELQENDVSPAGAPSCALLLASPVAFVYS